MKTLGKIKKENKEADAEYEDRIDEMIVEIIEIIESYIDVETHCGSFGDAEPDIEVDVWVSGRGFEELKKYLKEVIKC